MAKYEKFEEWMIGKKVEDEDGDRGVVARSCEDGTDTVWVLWETSDWTHGEELWCAVSELTFLETQDCEPESIPWQVGQVVWDIRYARPGKVDSINHFSKEVTVQFPRGYRTYTENGAPVDVHKEGRVRTLFFSEPRIIAETMPTKKPFVPKLKKGDKVLIKDKHGLFGEGTVRVVYEECDDRIYVSEDGNYFLKIDIASIQVLSEEVKFD